MQTETDLIEENMPQDLTVEPPPKIDDESGKKEPAPKKDPPPGDEDDLGELDEDSPEKVKAALKKEDKEPPPQHPRFKEVYANWKGAERKVEDMSEDIEAMRTHIQKLEGRLGELTEKDDELDDSNAPDPAVDPDGYKNFVKLKQIKVNKKNEEKRAAERLQDQKDLVSSMFDDYNDMVRLAERKMAKDPDSHARVWGSRNPFLAAYRFGKELSKANTSQEKEESVDDEPKKPAKEKENADEANRRRARSTVETDDNPPADDSDEEPELTEGERRVIKHLFPMTPFDKAKKEYLRNRKKMFGR